MVQPLPYLEETASQTAGPYLHIGMYPSVAGLNLRTQEKPNVLTSAVTEGEHIRVEGLIIDGAGAPLRDVLVEIWQANAHGRYHHPADTRDKPLDETFRGGAVRSRVSRPGSGGSRPSSRAGCRDGTATR